MHGRIKCAGDGTCSFSVTSTDLPFRTGRLKGMFHAPTKRVEKGARQSPNATFDSGLDQSHGAAVTLAMDVQDPTVGADAS